MEIVISNLVKDYGQHRVLEIEELKIARGSFCGIIGPNGAGKSTLVKILGGLDEATSGKIYYDGKENSKDAYQNMTVVFQKPYLLRGTVFYNIAYPLMLRKVAKKEIETRVRHLAEEMAMEDLLHRKAWTLSGGEAQKVALARALVFKPALLLLDEPTANIDPASMAVMESMMKQANEKEGTTILLVTHHIQQAKRLCKDIVFMDKGKVEEFGEAREVIFSSRNIKTKRFIEGEIII